ncbi:DUF3223 domain-containing protein [Phytobacter diazotrophicus]|uniref:DUF3223 domain-containing protein n=1 Tax=Phytobacter diazotrophicus TaxID=395631 RepID=UPI002FF839E6
MPYMIDNNSFSTKKELVEKAQEILHKTNDNEEVFGVDYAFLISLFKYHDEWEQKSIDGFSAIVVGKSLHGTRCFYLKTKTGLKDISFHHAIKCLKK